MGHHSFCLGFVVFKKTDCFEKGLKDLSSLSTDPPGELDVLGHDGDPLGVGRVRTLAQALTDVQWRFDALGIASRGRGLF